MSSLYIHIPFCKRKCLYCSFVISIGQEKRINDYLAALHVEAEFYKNLELGTIYIGGGTPTLIDCEQIKMLVNIIRKNFKINNGAEFTIEANPEGLDEKKAMLLRDLGFNRVSLGVQSLNNRYLKFLGRCHDRNAAIEAFRNLRRAKFPNINVDLMYSFPSQTKEEIKKDVCAITSLGSEHLSLYSLTIEPNSRFYAQKLSLGDSQYLRDQYKFICELITRAGFKQYEISNFSLDDKESQHNLIYWSGGNYIGLGVGAHSHIDGERFWNVPRTNIYISRLKENIKPIENREKLNLKKYFMERFLVGLRMNQGVDISKLEEETGGKLTQEKREIINEFIRVGFLIQEGNRIKAAFKGRIVLDELCSRLI